jgi:hypothetical protein
MPREPFVWPIFGSPCVYMCAESIYMCAALPAVWRVSCQIGAAGEKPAADANDGSKTLCAVLFIARRAGVMGTDLWRRQTAN